MCIISVVLLREATRQSGGMEMPTEEIYESRIGETRNHVRFTESVSEQHCDIFRCLLHQQRWIQFRVLQN